MSVSKIFLLVASGIAGGGALFGLIGYYNPIPEVIQMEYKGLQIEAIRNSETLSQAFAINAKGSVIGTREILDPSGQMLSVVSFFWGDSSSMDMPVPEDFSNVEAVGLSDNDLVIGFASRVVGHKDGSLRGIVWNPHSGKVDLLPPAEGDDTSQAQSINSQGDRIAGYSTGKERLRPALWSRNEASQEWDIQILDTIMDYNPYLMSSTLQISPDGKLIAGCCTEQILPSRIIDSSLFLWKTVDGVWERQLLNAEQLYIKDINNRGEMAGSIASSEGRLPCLVSAEGGLIMLELLPGDTAGEARGINRSGELVGWSELTRSAEGGHQPCTWAKDGKVSRVELSDIPYALAYGINDKGQIAGMMTIAASKEEHNESKPSNSFEEVALAFRTKPKP